MAFKLHISIPRKKENLDCNLTLPLKQTFYKTCMCYFDIVYSIVPSKCLFWPTKHGFSNPLMRGYPHFGKPICRQHVLGRGGDGSTPESKPRRVWKGLLLAPSLLSQGCRETTPKPAQKWYLCWQALGYAFEVIEDRIFSITQEPGLKWHLHQGIFLAIYIFLFTVTW